MIKVNIEKIQVRIDKACLEASRDPHSVQLLVATKTQSIESINKVIALGYGLIGENRAQEVVSKAPYLLDTKTTKTPRENHFIGHLQSNKINALFDHIDCFQSIDRFSIAHRLNNACVKNGVKKSILIQVNTSYEESKQGVMPHDLFALLEEIKALDHLIIRGFMTLGLNSDNEQKVREGFANLRTLNERAINEALIPENANALSMGMSHDLEWAILEGATIIRVGSAIFGERVLNQKA